MIWRNRLSSHAMIGSAAATTLLKVVSLGLAFLASLVYARTLGPDGYGQYAYVIAWVTLLTIPASLGLPQYLIREGSKTPVSLCSLRRWADQRVLVSGFLAAMLLCGASFAPQTGEARWLFLISAPIPLLASLSAVRQSLIQAHGWIARSQWPKLILAPSAVLLGITVLWELQDTIQPWQVMAMAAAAACLPVIANSFQLRRAAVEPDRERPVYPSLRSATPFIWVAGVYFLLSRTDLIMLGLFRSPEVVGVYAVASRAAEMLTVISTAITVTLAPLFAKLHSQRDTAELQRTLSTMTRRTLVATTPLALIMFFFAPQLLGLFYGEAYMDGSAILRILACSQLLTVTSGPLGSLLNMSGHERPHLTVIGVALMANILLNLALIPPFGSFGAAAATCASVATARLGLLALVRLKLGIRPSLFGP